MYPVVEAPPWSWLWLCQVTGPTCGGIRLLPFIFLWVIWLAATYYVTTYHVFKIDPPDIVADIFAFIWWGSAITFAMWPAIEGWL